jgi:hypothetical protein
MLLSRGEICSSRRRQWSEDDKGRIVLGGRPRRRVINADVGGVMISMRENVSDIGITPGLCLGLPAMAGVRSNRGAVQVNGLLIAAIFRR